MFLLSEDNNEEFKYPSDHQGCSQVQVAYHVSAGDLYIHTKIYEREKSRVAAVVPLVVIVVV